MNMRSRGAAALLLVLLTALPLGGCLGEPPVEAVTVVAENRFADGLLYTQYSDGTAMLTGYDGALTELILPDTVNGLRLTAIADGAFTDHATLQTLRCGPNITRIGNEAFYRCAALETVEFGTTVTDIGYYAFEGTPWLAAQTDDFIVAGDGILLKYQGSDRSVTIPDTVKRLSDAFFQNETVLEVTLGPNVEVIGDYAFAYCPALQVINFNENLREIGNSAFTYCENLRSVTLPPNVLTLGESAFLYCTSLRRAELNESLEKVGPNAFNACDELRALACGGALREIGDYAFFDCIALGGISYSGTAEEWAQITVGAGNGMLSSAALRFTGK